MRSRRRLCDEGVRTSSTSREPPLHLDQLCSKEHDTHRGKPFIDYVVSYLSKHGVKNIIMLLSDAESEVFRNHLDDGSKFGVNIGYGAIPRMGTAPAPKEASAHVDRTFVICYGDVLTDLDLRDDQIPQVEWRVMHPGAKHGGQDRLRRG